MQCGCAMSPGVRRLNLAIPAASDSSFVIVLDGNEDVLVLRVRFCVFFLQHITIGEWCVFFWSLSFRISPSKFLHKRKRRRMHFEYICARELTLRTASSTMAQKIGLALKG